jgi:hypothetical protein
MGCQKYNKQHSLPSSIQSIKGICVSIDMSQVTAERRSTVQGNRPPSVTFMVGTSHHCFQTLEQVSVPVSVYDRE